VSCRRSGKRPIILRPNTVDIVKLKAPLQKALERTLRQVRDWIIELLWEFTSRKRQYYAVHRGCG